MRLCSGIAAVGVLLAAPAFCQTGGQMAAPPVRVKARPAQASLMGTYEARRLETLDVQALPGGRIRFHLDVTGNAGGKSPHEGEAEGVLSVRSGVAVYVPPDAPKGSGARLTLRFQGRRVRITQTGSSLDVGFGVGVYANGVYVKTSDKPPKLDMASF